jgi:excisionase family DNA binding protein
MSQIRNRSRSAVTGGGLSTQRLAAEAEAVAFCTVLQLAFRWRISKRQVDRYIASGELIATRFGRSVRISAAEVARFEVSHSGVK